MPPFAKHLLNQKNISPSDTTEDTKSNLNTITFLYEKEKHIVHLLTRFHSTLEIHHLINILMIELKKLALVEAGNYQSFDGLHSFSASEHFKHQITIDLGPMGTMLFSRKRAYTQTAKSATHEVVNLFKPALQNALLYAEAMTRSMTCPLTKLKNRLAFNETLPREIELAKRHKMPLSLVLIDIDNFKIINDTYGHIVGDNILEKVAKTLQDTKRQSDMIFRYGGEEFTLCLNHINHTGVRKSAERIRKAIEKQIYIEKGQAIKITISLGIAHYNGLDSEKLFFEKADKALYLAKEQGRNRIFEYEIK